MFKVNKFKIFSVVLAFVGVSGKKIKRRNFSVNAIARDYNGVSFSTFPSLIILDFINWDSMVKVSLLQKKRYIFSFLPFFYPNELTKNFNNIIESIQTESKDSNNRFKKLKQI